MWQLYLAFLACMQAMLPDLTTVSIDIRTGVVHFGALIQAIQAILGIKYVDTDSGVMVVVRPEVLAFCGAFVVARLLIFA